MQFINTVKHAPGVAIDKILLLYFSLKYRVFTQENYEKAKQWVKELPKKPSTYEIILFLLPGIKPKTKVVKLLVRLMPPAFARLAREVDKRSGKKGENDKQKEPENNENNKNVRGKEDK